MIRSSARRRAAVPALPRPRHFIFLPYFHIQYTSTKPRRQRAPEADPLHQLFTSTRRSGAQPVCGHRWEWQYEQRDGAISERRRHSEYVPGRGWVDVDVDVEVEVDVQEKQKGHEEFDIDLITMRRVRKTPATPAAGGPEAAAGSGGDGRDQTPPDQPQTAGRVGRTGPATAPAADAPAAEIPTPTPTPVKPDQSKSTATNTTDTNSTPRRASSDPVAAEAIPAAVEQTAQDFNGAVEHRAGIETILGNAPPTENVVDTAPPATPLVDGHRAAAESTSAVVPAAVEEVADAVVQDLSAESLKSPPTIVPAAAEPCTPVEQADAVVQNLSDAVGHRTEVPLKSAPAATPAAAESVDQVADTVILDLPLKSLPAVVPVAAKPYTPVEQVAQGLPDVIEHRTEAPLESAPAETPGAVEEVADTVAQDLPAVLLAVEHQPPEASMETAADTVVRGLPAEPLESLPTIVSVAAEPCSSVNQVADTVVVQDLLAEPLAVEHHTEASMEPAEPLAVEHHTEASMEPAEPLAAKHQQPPEESVEKADRPAAEQTTNVVAAKPSPPTAATHSGTGQADVEAPVVATAPVSSSVVAPVAAADQDEDLDLLRPSDVRAAAGAPGKMSRRIEGDAEKARRRAQMLVEFEAAEEKRERESLEGVKARIKGVGKAAEEGRVGDENAGSKMPGTEKLPAPQQLGWEPAPTHAEPTPIHTKPAPLPEAHKFFVLIYNPDSNDMQLSALPSGVSVRETTAFDSLQTLRSPERFLPLWHVLQKGGFTVVGGEGDCLVLKVGAGVAMEKRELVMREIGARILPAASAEVGMPAAVTVPEQQQQKLVKEPQDSVKEPQQQQELVQELQETVKLPQQDQKQQKQKQKTRPFRRVFWTAVWVAACSGVVSVGLEEYL